MKTQQSDTDVKLYIVDSFSEDKITERESAVIHTHLSSLMQELLRQTSIDEEG